MTSAYSRCFSPVLRSFVNVLCLLLFGLVPGPSCGNAVDFTDCALACATDGSCPKGSTCNNKRCTRRSQCSAQALPAAGNAGDAGFGGDHAGGGGHAGSRNSSGGSE